MIFLALFVLYATALSVALSRAGLRNTSPSSPGGARARPDRVLIIGATGGTGRELVTQALLRGYAVTAMARNPGRMRVEHPGLTVVTGDVLDEARVEAAMRGQDAVLCALGHKRWFIPTRILSRGTLNLLAAMEARGIRRFVCVTSLGIGDGAFRLGLVYTFFIIPAILPFYFWDKTRQERAIAAGGADWVIVRPGALTGGAMRGRLTTGRRVGHLFRTVRVSRADVASFMLDQLESDAYLRSAAGVAW